MGIYDGPLVPAVGPQELAGDLAGARHRGDRARWRRTPVFPGNDLPGVWLGRGAARLAGVHGIAPGAERSW